MLNKIINRIGFTKNLRRATRGVINNGRDRDPKRFDLRPNGSKRSHKIRKIQLFFRGGHFVIDERGGCLMGRKIFIFSLVPAVARVLSARATIIRPIKFPRRPYGPRDGTLEYGFFGYNLRADAYGY